MRRLPLFLAASVLLNLFLVGAIAGGVIRLRHHRPMIMAGSLRIAGAELPDGERRAFRAAMQAARRSMRPALEESRASREQAAALLRQPTVDQPAVRAALARARVADAQVREAVELRAVAFAATLPPADRARLADAMARRAEKGRL